MVPLYAVLSATVLGEPALPPGGVMVQVIAVGKVIVQSPAAGLCPALMWTFLRKPEPAVAVTAVMTGPAMARSGTMAPAVSADGICGPT